MYQAIPNRILTWRGCMEDIICSRDWSYTSIRRYYYFFFISSTVFLFFCLGSSLIFGQACEYLGRTEKKTGKAITNWCCQIHLSVCRLSTLTSNFITWVNSDSTISSYQLYKSKIRKWIFINFSFIFFFWREKKRETPYKMTYIYRFTRKKSPRLTL